MTNGSGCESGCTRADVRVDARADFRGSHWSRQITWHKSGCESRCKSGCTRSCDLSEPMRALAHPLSHENLTFDSNSTSDRDIRCAKKLWVLFTIHIYSLEVFKSVEIVIRERGAYQKWKNCKTIHNSCRINMVMVLDLSIPFQFFNLNKRRLPEV